MRDRDRLPYLQVALLVCGAIALLVYPLMAVWPSGWAWTPGRAPRAVRAPHAPVADRG